MKLRLLLLALALTAAGSGRAQEATAAEQVLGLLAAGEQLQARAQLVALQPRLPERERALLELVLDLAAHGRRERPGEEAGLEARAVALAAEATPGELPLLRRATALVGRARLHLTPLVRAAYRAVGPGQPRVSLVAWADDPDPRLRQLAISALAAQLAPLRAVVNQGGELTVEQERELADPGLIQLLIARLGERAPGTDRLPADLAARSWGTATALHALVLIEAAALPALEASRRRYPGCEEAIAAVVAAVRERLHRYPGSTWSSARGSLPRTTLGELTHCERPLAPAARFCPICGQEARRVCVSCGELRPVQSESCPNCGADADPPGPRVDCPRCGAHLTPGGKFCALCGGSLTPPGNGR